MSEGDTVICINDDWPHIKKFSNTDNEYMEPFITPNIDEILVVDEILGDFYRFEKYDPDSVGCNWWHKSRFNYY